MVFKRIPTNWKNVIYILQYVNHGKQNCTLLDLPKSLIIDHFSSIKKIQVSLLKMNNFESVVNFYGLKKPSTIFDSEDVVYLSKEIKHDIFLNNAEIEPIFNPFRKFDQIIYLIVDNGQIRLLANEKPLPKLLICKISKNCIFQTTDPQRFE